MEEMLKLLREIGPGRMSSTAYDTAWVARLNEIDLELSNKSLEWISENQLPDGSWGAKDIYYYHDRVICTLASMIALTHRGKRTHDKTQIEKGLLALEKITAGATQGLASDPNGSTIGFEMIAPTLVAEAEKLGIIKQQGNRILGRLGNMRSRKIEKLAGRKINKTLTLAFSSEMAGIDQQFMLDEENLQEANGSVAHSPSATAYFAKYLKPGNAEAMVYLNQWVASDGGVPDDDPFDVFEPAWVLWNLNLIPDLDPEITKLFMPHLDELQKNWDSTKGVGHALEYNAKDSDDSALVFDLLAQFGREVDIQGILHYEEQEHFRCFELEANPSVSANIHVLGALKMADYESHHPSVQKILSFLISNQTGGEFWFDKWHASPYYATSHVIIIASGYADVLCRGAVEWIIDTQNADGSWGFYNPTAEETAYALQALIFARRYGSKIPESVIQSGLRWLLAHKELPYTPLWIGKALYTPILVVQSTVLSAIALAQKG
jgi:halimadienyl-diphosphate synthase